MLTPSSRASPRIRLKSTVLVLTQAGCSGGRQVPAVLAGQPSTAERRPCQQTEPCVDAGRNDLQLDLADQQAVAWLHHHRAGEVKRRCETHRLLNLPTQVVRQSRIEHLALVHGVVEEPECLLQWS